jgi:hypothetical protein
MIVNEIARLSLETTSGEPGCPIMLHPLRRGDEAATYSNMKEGETQ